MKRYNRQKKFKSFRFPIEVVAAFALLSWSCFNYVPVVSEMVKDPLRQNVAVFVPSFHVFMIVNVLVLLICVLSSKSPTKPDLYDEYVTTTNTTKVPGRRIHAAADHDDDSQEPEEPVVDKQIICVDNAVTSPPAAQNTRLSLTVTDCEKRGRVDVSPVGEVTESEDVSPVGEVTESEKTKYSRSRSERYERADRPVLRRSETVVEREMVAVRNEQARWSSAMDDLSSEEFRMKIDTFIASRKKTLIRENTQDLKLERKEVVAVTLRA